MRGNLDLEFRWRRGKCWTWKEQGESQYASRSRTKEEKEGKKTIDKHLSHSCFWKEGAEEYKISLQGLRKGRRERSIL